MKVDPDQLSKNKEIEKEVQIQLGAYKTSIGK